MPRTRRASQGGDCYHVLHRGNARRTVFHKDADPAALLLSDAQALPSGGLAPKRWRFERLHAMAADRSCSSESSSLGDRQIQIYPFRASWTRRASRRKPDVDSRTPKFGRYHVGLTPRRSPGRCLGKFVPAARLTIRRDMSGRAASRHSPFKKTITCLRCCGTSNATRCVRTSWRGPRIGVGRAWRRSKKVAGRRWTHGQCDAGRLAQVRERAPD